MAAMVAQHFGDHWHRREDQTSNMPVLAMNNGLPTSATSVSQHYQGAQAVGSLLPAFSPTYSTSHVPSYGGPTYGFNPNAVPNYNMQPPYTTTSQSAYHSMPAPCTTTMNTPVMQPIPFAARSQEPPPQPVYSPLIKSESQPQPRTIQRAATSASPASTLMSPMAETGESLFTTDVDCLMRAIQAKSDATGPSAPSEQAKMERIESDNRQLLPMNPPLPPPPAITVAAHAPVAVAPESRPKPRKRYACAIPDCNKTFYQKTHLEIHTRTHTGIKPFVCREPECGQRFSQLGNLKTHERRHTGERPYTCDICGKTFAQRGNVRAHKIVHQQIKPYTCKLDNCGKHFTQLGNLKSHQNKFHSNTLRYLTTKFAQTNSEESVSQQDRELWDYFASLYRHSNNGIKGRGKDRRIASVGPTNSTNVDADPGSRSMSQSTSPTTSMPPPVTVHTTDVSIGQPLPKTPVVMHNTAPAYPAQSMQMSRPPSYSPQHQEAPLQQHRPQPQPPSHTHLHSQHGHSHLQQHPHQHGHQHPHPVPHQHQHQHQHQNQHEHHHNSLPPPPPITMSAPVGAHPPPPPPPMRMQYVPPPVNHPMYCQMDEHSGYNNSVFPERKMF